MGLLKKAVNEQAYLKCGIYGEAGSGKTTTSSYLAMAISQQLGNKKPVAFFETEAGSDFLVNRFELEGIELLRIKSHSLADLIAAGKEAEETCSILIVDSVSHVWADLLESKLRAVNEMKRKRGWETIDSLEFQHYNDVKREWARWTTFFLNSNLHIIVCGRAGDIWEHTVNEKGKKELSKGGTKMKAEKEFGYEPSLCIEMLRVSKNKDQGWIHRASILKDRSDNINGRIFDFAKPKAGYKKGDWKAVYTALQPAIMALNLGAQQNTYDASRTSKELFPGENGESRSHVREQHRVVMLEEMYGLIEKYWAGSSESNKKMRSEIAFKLFNTRSKTAVDSLSVEKLKPAISVLQSLDALIEKGDLNKEKTEDVLNAIEQYQNAMLDLQIAAASDDVPEYPIEI